jgi:hypothetical protein
VQVEILTLIEIQLAVQALVETLFGMTLELLERQTQALVEAAVVSVEALEESLGSLVVHTGEVEAVGLAL